MGDTATRLCTPPVELEVQCPTTLEPIYPSWKSHFNPVFQKTRAFLTQRGDKDTNIVVLGPTGAGKSTIINMLFNRKVAKVKATAKSVTKQMHIYSGTFTFREQTRTVNVIDSVGFCDSVMPASDVTRMVKEFIKSSVFHVHKVLIVCAGRIEDEQSQAIKNFMEWLDYQHYKSQFIFIYNKSENLTPAERTECLGEMCDLLGADSNFGAIEDVAGEQVRLNYTISTAFPAHFRLEQIGDDLRNLYNAAFYIRKDHRAIEVQEASCRIL
ncbi:unnamed protein product [Prorocentrum cordatum]|uniref:AIG1-type G domain-containing protein n=1 Tax=Prorocentrum cordatum TaxID=2364126 RepID=A0ABN9WGU8_9DINO|nr:unnamed protein product [Polarella glacialis]